jgi:hypothetical protein
MKIGYTHITFVLDNSGSMSHLKPATIEGYNAFLTKQKAEPGKLTWSLYQFKSGAAPMMVPNWAQTPVWNPGQPVLFGGAAGGVSAAVANSNIAMGQTFINGIGGNAIRPKSQQVDAVYEMQDATRIPLLNGETYKCDFGTPLLDAIGAGITRTGEYLSALAEEERPEKVIVVILTDGEENQSSEFVHEQVMGLIKSQTEIYKWDFVFLGANQDAIAVGASYGIAAQSSMSYVADAHSLGSTYNSLSATVSASRALGAGATVNFTSAMRTAAMGGKEETVG